MLHPDCGGSRAMAGVPAVERRVGGVCICIAPRTFDALPKPGVCGGTARCTFAGTCGDNAVLTTFGTCGTSLRDETAAGVFDPKKEFLDF